MLDAPPRSACISAMLAVKGLYDGKSIQLLEKRLPAEPQQVIVTFLGDGHDDQQDSIYSLAHEGGSFDFLEQEEDLYSEQDLVRRYK